MGSSGRASIPDPEVSLSVDHIRMLVASNCWCLHIYPLNLQGQDGLSEPSLSDTEDAPASHGNNTQAGTRMTHKAREWSLTHSYFAAMGGFAFEITDPSRNFFPCANPLRGRPTRLMVTSDALLYLDKHRPEMIPDLPLERIADKSKANMMAKLLVCLQGRYPTRSAKYVRRCTH